MAADAKDLAAYTLKIIILKQQNQKIVIKTTDQALELVVRILVKVVKAVNKAIKDGSDKAVAARRMSSKDIVLIFSSNADTVIKDKN